MPFPRSTLTGRRACFGLLTAAMTLLLGACGGVNLGSLGGSTPPAAGPPEPATALGTGKVRAALLLPLSANGSPGVAAQSMRNAAELALSEFNAPNVQLLVKDDGGTFQGGQQATEAALSEGAEIILGPLLGPAVAGAGQTARARNVPVIGFSSDATVATRGVYLLSFLPESDVDRVIDYAASRGKRSFAALIPENAYGNVVDAAFRQAVTRNNGRVAALERYPADAARVQETVRRIGPALAQADALFIPGEPEAVLPVAQALATEGVNIKRLQLLGTGPWDDQRVYSDSTLQNGWFAAPESSGFRSFSTRYRTRYGQDPLRAATLSYDAVSLVAALVKTQGPQRFSDQVLASPSGFSGIEGIFRFRPDGGNDRGLSIMRVTPSGPQPVSPAPKAFPGQT
jgi:ABC-type branched-subunit amino acid transport system substrate-binding protein